MKKNIALLLGLVLGLGFVSCSDNDNDDEDQSTRVEDQYLSEITTTRYEWKNGERSSEGKTYEIVRYNEKGQRVGGENLFYAIKMSYENVYDDNGRLIETSLYESDKFSYKYTYEYNSYGDMSSESRSTGNGTVRVVKYDYDDNRRLIQEYEYYKDEEAGKSFEGNTLIHEYGENTYTTYKYYSNTLLQKSIDEYDSHHGVIKTTVIHDDGSKDVLEYKNEYDSKGRLIKSVGPIFVEGVNSTRYASTQYLDISYDEDGKCYKEHYKIPEKDEEYDLEYTYKYKKK